MRDKKIESKNIISGYEWNDEIPYLNFPKKWAVQIVKPMLYTIVQFYIKQNKGFVGVYLEYSEDSKPHWKISPDKKSDRLKFNINETKDLFKAIQESLDEQNGKEFKYKTKDKIVEAYDFSKTKVDKNDNFLWNVRYGVENEKSDYFLDNIQIKKDDIILIDKSGKKEICSKKEFLEKYEKVENE